MTNKTTKYPLTQSYQKTESLASEKKRFWLGILLWSLLVLSYFIFIVNWLLPPQLAGFVYTDSLGKSKNIPGWKEVFFGTEGKISFAQESLNNVGITAARGLATLFLGVVVSRVSHKFAVVGSLVLLSFGFAAGFATNYWLYLLSRFIMAIGGTTLIVLIQPVISRFFNQKQRPYFSQISPMFYPLGGLVSFSIFSNPEVKLVLTQHYQITMAATSSITFLFILLYVIFGQNFDILKGSDQNLSNASLKPSTYWGIIKEKQTWIWIFYYGSWLIAYVLPTVTYSKIIRPWNPQLYNSFGGGWTGTFGMWIFVGSMLGFFGGFWNKTKLPRKPYMGMTMLVFFLALILLVIAGLSKNVNQAYITSCVGGFLIGLASIGMQTVMLNIPHEYSGNSPKRMQIFMGYIWGGGYLIFTLIDFVINTLIDGYASSKTQELEFPSGPIGVLIAVFVIFAVLLLFIKESKPGCIFKCKKISLKN